MPSGRGGGQVRCMAGAMGKRLDVGPDEDMVRQAKKGQLPKAKRRRKAVKE